MSHFMIKSPFLPESLGLDYDSPRSRSFGLHAAVLRGSPRPLFRNVFSGLPRWLRFKTTPRGTCGAQDASEAPTSAKKDESQKTSQRTLRRDSSLSISTRSGKSATSGSSLRKKVEEHEMKTKTEEWKKNHEYRVVRERRNLSKKHLNPRLRLIKRFYFPSVFFICLGVIFIFGSTVHSIGDGTVLWTYRETFKIAGSVTITMGVIMLMFTVGCESRSSEKWKRKGIREKNPLIHPDFLKKPGETGLNMRTLNPTPENSLNPDNFQSGYKRKFRHNDTNKDGGNYYLCSSSQSARSLVSEMTEAEKLIRHKQTSNDVLQMTIDPFQSFSAEERSNPVLKMNGHRKERQMFEVADDEMEQTFLCSSIQSM